LFCEDQSMLIFRNLQQTVISLAFYKDLGKMRVQIFDLHVPPYFNSFVQEFLKQKHAAIRCTLIASHRQRQY
jgi:hypothetical protein